MMMRVCEQRPKSNLLPVTSPQPQSCIRWQQARFRKPSTIRILSKKSEIVLRACRVRMRRFVEAASELARRRSLDTGGPSSYDQNRYEYETAGGANCSVRLPIWLRGIAKAQRTHSQGKNSGARVAGSPRKTDPG